MSRKYPYSEYLMKLQHEAMLVSALILSPPSYAEGWLDSIKNFLGMSVEAEKPVMPNVTDMVGSVSESLGVSKEQALGGLGAIFNYAKNNISAEQFATISKSLPGVSDLLKAAPDVSQLESSTGLSGLMDKAASYNASLKAINDVKKQFEALGLQPEMITAFVQQAKAYLDTDEGKKIKDTLLQGLGNFKL
jgi:hypothetical protein